MSLFYDTELLEAMEDIVNELIEEKIEYRATLSLHTKQKRPIATIETKYFQVIIQRKRKLAFVLKDKAKYQHAVKEGFTEEEIFDKIKCYFNGFTKDMIIAALLEPQLVSEKYKNMSV